MTRPLIITRPQEFSEEFAQRVLDEMPGKFAPVVAPLLIIRDEPASVDVSGAQALLFTSRHGVRAFAKRSRNRDLPALCVGDATANEAARVGFSAMSANGDASALAVLAAQSYLPDFGFMLHFRGAETTGDIVNSLMGEGIPAEERIIYDQIPSRLGNEAQHIIAGNQSVAVVFSPRSANLFADEVSGLDVRGMTIVAISANAAAPLARLNVNEILIAEMPSVQAILKKLQAI